MRKIITLFFLLVSMAGASLLYAKDWYTVGTVGFSTDAVSTPPLPLTVNEYKYQ
jgi:hypothetical protein